MERLGWRAPATERSAVSRRRSKGRGRRGCFETAAIVFFALILGAFAASTFYRHSGALGPTARSEESRGLADPPERSSSVVPGRARIRVSVRNGSGIAGAAERMTVHLRREGFDVVDFGNAERFDYPRTIVIDRSGKPAFAREVAATLQGVPIESAPDPTLFLDVTVRIGRDLPRILQEEDGEEGKEEGGDPGGAGRGWRDWLERLPWR